MAVIEEPIYKFAHIDKNNNIKTLYVFIGQNANKITSEALNRLFIQKPTDDAFKGVFTEDEINEINETSPAPKIIFIPESIHLDDTIEIVKKKFLFRLMYDLNTSYDELYFYIRQTTRFNTKNIYNDLTQGESLELTKEQLEFFLLNIYDFDIQSIPDKPVYNYNDILKLNLSESSFLVNKPLGHMFKISNQTNPYIFTVNPYYTDKHDTFLENRASDITKTTNKHLLMHTGTFFNNTIYVCLAEETLQKIDREEITGFDNNLTEESVVKIYYPYLYEKDITSIELLRDQKERLLGETKKLLTTQFEKINDSINLFYDIYKFRKQEINYSGLGLKSILLNVRQPNYFVVPLDVIFKLIHATQDIPLIKMNQSKRQEKIYRLYTDKLSTNGKKYHTWKKELYLSGIMLWQRVNVYPFI